MSQTKVYVGNLSYDASGPDLESYFAKYGEVADVKLITDRETGRSKGFAFVTFAAPESTTAAIEDANNSEFMGRKLRVNIANDNTRRGGGGGGGRQQDRGGDRGGW